jgi:hypothetical protein
MNYAFIPGIEPEFDALRTVVAQRANTQIVGGPGVKTVEDFLSHLDLLIETIGIARADDLITGSHGTAEGEMLIRLDSSVPALNQWKTIPVVYEDLLRVIASQSIRIPSGVKTANTNFRMEMCSLGADNDKPFLRKLKEALGSPKTVSAPRYIHSLSTIDGVSYYEYMKYEFWAFGLDHGSKPQPNRDAVKAAFAAGGFQFSDGTNIPPANWETWLPVASKINLDPVVAQNINIGVAVTLNQADGLPAPGELGNWLSGSERITLPLQAGSKAPKTQADMVSALLASLPNDPAYKDTYDYPVYKRYHFQSLQDFVNGWDWTVSQAGTNQLQYVGTRYRYELWIPVTEPGTDRLIYNYYPASGAPIMHFTVNDHPKLFGVV